MRLVGRSDFDRGGRGRSTVGWWWWRRLDARDPRAATTGLREDLGDGLRDHLDGLALRRCVVKDHSGRLAMNLRGAEQIAVLAIAHDEQRIERRGVRVRDPTATATPGFRDVEIEDHVGSGCTLRDALESALRMQPL